MDLITPDQAEALVEKVTTLREWAMAQSVELDEPRVGKQTMLDRLGVRLSTTRWRGLGGGIDDKGLVTVALRPV
jgi:hypothetical protein